MKYSVLLGVLFGAILATGACNQFSQQRQFEEQVERPREAWVLRSVLDRRPRMLSVALDDSLWVAYNTETASLYKAWIGGINFQGPVYTAAHGPQPTTKGIDYMKEPDGIPWRIVKDGNETIPEVFYKGHTLQDNGVTLTYELVSEGNKVTVEEKPEFFSTEAGLVGFRRDFVVKNVPDGRQVVLKMSLNSLLNEEDYQTNGRFILSNKTSETINKQKFYALNGHLILNSNGATRFSVQMAPKSPAHEDDEQSSGEEGVSVLMAKSDCNTCHNKETKTVGPSYEAIAKKYDNSDLNRTRLIKKIIAGGSGIWGDVPMTPHPDLKKEDVDMMVSYILSLDAKQEKERPENKFMPKPEYGIAFQEVSPAQLSKITVKPGIAVNIYQFDFIVTDFPKIDDDLLPTFSGSINTLHIDNNDFGAFEKYFVLHATGYINMKNTTNVVFRLVSDDGSKLYIDDKLVLDHGGLHALEPKDAEIILEEGKHSFRVEYFQGGGGRALSLQWSPHGAEAFAVVPPEVFTFKGDAIKNSQASPIAAKKDGLPGDGASLSAVHPSFNLTQARPENFKPKVGGMDFLPDGRMVISTWDSLGAVYILDGVQGNNPEDIEVKRIAFGLAEPLGLKVVEGEIYVLQKQELTKLIDLDGDDIIDEYQTVTNGWKVSDNFHEFAFGLVYKDGYFYGTLATAISPGGSSKKNQAPDRGKVLRISKEDGSYSLIASGLRTPNGIGIGVDNEIFIADNQGDWVPASKIIHLQEDGWYGSRSVDFEGTEGLTETPPAVWLQQGEIANSPSQPVKINVDPYKNQMLYGDVTHGGIKRVFVEKVNDEYQGAAFRFTQGLEAGVNRLAWGPDSALYIGGVGSVGNWQHFGKLGYGLQKLTFNNKIAFEMLAVRAKPSGIEIEFTEPLKEGAGSRASDYTIRQWHYKATADYGGPKIDEKGLDIRSVTISDDHKKVFLELGGMKAKHVIYVKLNRKSFESSTGKSLWSTEAWYTMNNIPASTAKGLAKK